MTDSSQIARITTQHVMSRLQTRKKGEAGFVGDEANRPKFKL